MGLYALVQKYCSEALIDTIFLRGFGVLHIPLLGYVRPRVLRADSQELQLLIPLNRRTRNHLHSMYFGALMIGADAAAGFYAAKLIFLKKYRIDYVFKSVSANFLKRPEGDVVFSCAQGEEIAAKVEQAQQTGERVEILLKVVASVPALANIPVAEIDMLLSLKRRQN